MAKELNETSDDFLVIVMTTVDTSLNHLRDGLPEAIYRCGGSKDAFGARPLLGGYCLVGVPDCRDLGHEVKPRDTCPEISADVSVWSNADGFTINEELSTGRNYLKSTMANRTAKENRRWKSFNAEQMLRYGALCELEYAALLGSLANYCGVSYFSKALCLILVAIGFGHIFTQVGRRAWYVVRWKYLRFLQVVFGIWTDEMVELYQIHDTVHSYSGVWDDPFVKREMVEIGEAETLTKRQASSRYSAFADDSNDRLEYFERRRKQSKHLDHEKLLRDYSAALYATIAPRATFLLLVPFVSFLSIFASYTAGYPIFVYSHKLSINLMPGISRDINEIITDEAMQEVDKVWFIKEEETTEESYTISVPSQAEEANEYPRELSRLRQDIERKNEISRTRQKAVLQEKKVVLRHWEVKLSWLSTFLGRSRYILFGKGLFKCLISIILLNADEKWMEMLGIISLVGFAPFCLAAGFDLFIAVGCAFWISDEELYRELGCFVRFFSWICKCCPQWLSSKKASEQITTSVVPAVDTKDLYLADEIPSGGGDDRNPDPELFSHSNGLKKAMKAPNPSSCVSQKPMVS